MRTIHLAALILWLFSASCTPSLVYSPSLGLTQKPLEKGQFDLSGGIGMLPETRPDATAQIGTGYFGSLAYGFSNRFSLQTSGWISNQSANQYDRSGVALHARIAFREKEKSHFELIPRVAFLFGGNSNDGTGIQIAGVYAYRPYTWLHLYSGFGPAIGSYGTEKIAVPNTSETRFPYGWGFIGHLGIGVYPLEKLRIVLEANPILQINEFERKNNTLLVPSLTLGYSF